MYDNYQFKELKWPYLKAKTTKNYRRTHNLLIAMMQLGTIYLGVWNIFIYKEWLINLNYWSQRRENLMRQKESYNLVIAGHNSLEQNFIKTFSSF